MKFTQGQKQALTRKIEAIIAEKREAKKEELKKSFKLSPEQKEFVEKLKKVNKALVAYKNAVKEAGLDFNWSQINGPVNGISFSFQHNNDKPVDEVYLDDLANIYVRDKYNDSFPDQWEIADDLELQTLSKDFDIEAFLDKYRNL